MDEEPVKDDRISGRGLLTVPDAAWELAVERAAVIGPLAESSTGGYAVDEAATKLGISRERVYFLIRLWRGGQGAVSDLVPGRSSGGRGGARLPVEVETIVREVIRKHYLTRQRKTIAAVHREIIRMCRLRGLPAPSRGAVRRRIAMLDPRTETVGREGREAARPLQSAGGDVPAIVEVLEQVQIDHTVVDLIVVDEQHRLPIGRPYVTVAIDVRSRSIVGLVITLEAPSALSVGLCLAHMLTDKRASLERLGVEVTWPMSGKPRELYLDKWATDTPITTCPKSVTETPTDRNPVSGVSGMIRGMGHLLGYARVSTVDQDPALQLDALTSAGCARVWVDRASGALTERPELDALLAALLPGDTLVVWKLDRLGRSLSHLLTVVNELAERGIGFRSLTEGMDTTTAAGRLLLAVCGALAQFERDLIRERTVAGLDAARRRGSQPGRPTVMTPDRIATARTMAAAGVPIARIARTLGVGRATLYRALSDSR